MPDEPTPAQQQPMPGTTEAMDPHPDHGEESYVGHGRLAGKKTVITGADSGIGRAVAIAFAREGADVLISYLNEDEDAREGAVTSMELPLAVPAPGGQGITMSQTTARYERHRFPRAIIAHAVWLYLRFPLSLRAVEERLLERGVEVSYETLRRWVAKFGPVIARGLRRRQARPGRVWRLDEVQISIRGRRFWLWRAVDEHGVALDEILQPLRERKAAKRLLRRPMKTAGHPPKRIATDKLACLSGGEARGRARPRATCAHKGLSNRAENSHLPFRSRERVMRGHCSPGRLQRFVSMRPAIRNRFVPPVASAQATGHHRLEALRLAAGRRPRRLNHATRGVLRPARVNVTAPLFEPCGEGPDHRGAACLCLRDPGIKSAAGVGVSLSRSDSAAAHGGGEPTPEVGHQAASASCSTRAIAAAACPGSVATGCTSIQASALEEGSAGVALASAPAVSNRPRHLCAGRGAGPVCRWATKCCDRGEACRRGPAPAPRATAPGRPRSPRLCGA